ncbi:PAS domain S-box protein [delta proteobacterium NaphS2]|nr:PAS domain S-box protein [delta proteobacterium NaphS2]
MLEPAINWKEVIDSLKKGVVVIDTGGIIRHVNPAMMGLTGYGADELLGNSCAIFECSCCNSRQSRGGRWCTPFSPGKSTKPVFCKINCKSGFPLEVVRQASLLYDAKSVTLGAVETFVPATIRMLPSFSI